MADLFPLPFQPGQVVTSLSAECFGMDAKIVGVLPEGVETYRPWPEYIKYIGDNSSETRYVWEKGLAWYVCAVDKSTKLPRKQWPIVGVYREEPFRSGDTCRSLGLVIDRIYPDGIPNILGEPVAASRLPSGVAVWWWRFNVAGWHTTTIVKYSDGRGGRQPYAEEDMPLVQAHAARQVVLRQRKADDKASREVI